MEIDINKIKGIFIPTNLLRVKRLSPRMVYIYGLILTLDRENDFKGVDLSNEKLSEFFGISKRQISSMLSKLETLGYITIIIVKEAGNVRRIFSGKIIKS